MTTLSPSSNPNKMAAQSSLSFAAVAGNCLHGFNLFNIAVYGWALYAYGTDPSSAVFDDAWLQAGFCMPHDDNVSYSQTTHDYSGHIMTILALLGLAALQVLKRRRPTTTTTPPPPKIRHDNITIHSQLLDNAYGMAFWALMGALGHASGHYLIAYARRNNFYPPAQETFLDDLRRSRPLEAIGKAGPSLPLFWMPLVKTYMMHTSKGHVALVALVCWAGSMFMQVRFGFSYTQAVLFAGLSIDQLMLPADEKNSLEYVLWPLLTTVPNGLFAWLESTACTTSPWMKQHGHLVYDLYMVSSYILFYLTCWLRVQYNSYGVRVKRKSL